LPAQVGDLALNAKPDQVQPVVVIKGDRLEVAASPGDASDTMGQAIVR
jgi:hypothetical protein